MSHHLDKLCTIAFKRNTEDAPLIFPHVTNEFEQVTSTSALLVLLILVSFTLNLKRVLFVEKNWKSNYQQKVKFVQLSL